MRQCAPIATSGVIVGRTAFAYGRTMLERVVQAWEFDVSCDLGEIVELARGGDAPPSFTGRLLSTRGDTLSVQVTTGRPTGGPRSLYYVAGHGAFLLARREEWPPARPGAEKRLLVTLLAFPQPVASAEHAR